MDRLTRNYKLNPLGAKELIPFEDLVYLYIELNLCFEEISSIVGKSSNSVSKQCRKHGLIKTKEKQKESLQNYYLKTIGVKNPAQLKSSQDKMKKTMLEKYGVENIAFRKETIDKRRKTCLEKYGVDNPAKVKEHSEKKKQTNLERYGVEYAQSSNKIKQKQQETNFKRYGCKVPLQNKDIKEKQENTCLEKYGTKNPFQNKEIQEKYNKTILERFGVDNVAKSDYCKQKAIQTCLEKYGVENVADLPETKEKIKQTCIEKYGVENVSQVKEFQNKKYDTMTENDTWWGKSKPEQDILELLQSKYSNVEHNYNKDPRYPFLCDFYIPELDLFIEYQGFVSHGYKPYEGTKEDQKLIDFWTMKAENHEDPDNAYYGYIYNWTIEDVKKRQTAKDNNLNWIEFFNFKEFLDWFNFQ